MASIPAAKWSCVAYSSPNPPPACGAMSWSGTPPPALVNGPGEKSVIPAVALSDQDRRVASVNEYDPPTSMNVAPNESAPRQSPRVDRWKQVLLAAPNPIEPKIAAAAPTSRPKVTPRYGCAFEKLRLPPIAVKAPTLASANVPRRGACSTPFDGDALR